MMSNPKLTRKCAEQTCAALKQAYEKGYQKGGMPSAYNMAANALGIGRNTLQTRLEGARLYYGLTVAEHTDPDPISHHEPKPELPVFPEDDLPVDELVDFMCRRFEKRIARAKSERWFRIKMPDNLPFGLNNFGDPHLDSNGCNITLLREHSKIVASTPGMYGINVGDLTDNWVGRLMRLYADSDQSRSTAKKLLKWFLCDSGIKWLCHVMGNHDGWNFFIETIKEIVGERVPVMNDEARFIVETPNGVTYPIWVRHNFEGHSMWNTLHGPQKAARMKEAAALYICGHLHNWALHEEESASRGHVYWLARARGYKYLDPYQTALGHDAQAYGASITAICNPMAPTLPGRMRLFPDVQEATDYLTFLRKRKAA